MKLQVANLSPYVIFSSFICLLVCCFVCFLACPVLDKNQAVTTSVQIKLLGENILLFRWWGGDLVSLFPPYVCLGDEVAVKIMVNSGLVKKLKAMVADTPYLALVQIQK